MKVEDIIGWYVYLIRKLALKFKYFGDGVDSNVDNEIGIGNAEKVKL